VARRTDRIEAFAARLQAAGEAVHLAADALAVEQFHHRLAGEADIARLDVGGAPREASLRDPGDELLVDGFGGVHPGD
jgi:hypothetical protein